MHHSWVHKAFNNNQLTGLLKSKLLADTVNTMPIYKHIG